MHPALKLICLFTTLFFVFTLVDSLYYANYPHDVVYDGYTEPTYNRYSYFPNYRYYYDNYYYRYNNYLNHYYNYYYNYYNRNYNYYYDYYSRNYDYYYNNYYNNWRWPTTYEYTTYEYY